MERLMEALEKHFHFFDARPAKSQIKGDIAIIRML